VSGRTPGGCRASREPARALGVVRPPAAQGLEVRPVIPPRLAPILLLIGSNLFMTTAWYGHLRFKTLPLWMVVLPSWGLAFFEYWLAVPANRIGSSVYSAAQLKAIQEVITLAVFAAFSVVYLGQKITYNHLIGFALIAAGAFFVFRSPGVGG
jgi:uncharacterized protein